MSEHELQIPERLQQIAHEPLIVGIDRAVEQHQEVDVRVQAEMTPAVAPERDHADGVVRGRRVPDDLIDDRVDAIGVAFDRRAASAAGHGRLD